jgi:hypothetical protein
LCDEVDVIPPTPPCEGRTQQQGAFLGRERSPRFWGCFELHVANDLTRFRSQKPVSTRNRFQQETGFKPLRPIFRLQLPITKI